MSERWKPLVVVASLLGLVLTYIPAAALVSYFLGDVVSQATHPLVGILCGIFCGVAFVFAGGVVASVVLEEWL